MGNFSNPPALYKKDPKMSAFFASLGKDVSTFALDRVTACIHNPTEELLADPVTQLAALYCYNNQAPHQCYWNPRFCIAVSCNLPERLQKQAAWCAVSNGLNSYWCWITHSEFNAATVLRRLEITGIPDESSAACVYCRMSEPVAKQLIERFCLPTLRLTNKHTLDANEAEERRVLNSHYPYDAAL